ncbi:MAG TPA: LptF/LptG family permease [Sphingobacterium sp.]|nr:LptF/LptG family permease [Sphingobacterium sp.]
MNIIDRYIFKKYMTTFVFTLLIFTIIMVIFDVSERIDDFTAHDAPLSKIVTEYYAGFIPFYLNLLSPLINFIAVIFFTSKMADQTEIVPILSGGMSFYRMLRPYMLGAFLVFVFSFVSNVFIVPVTNKLKVGFENVYVKPDRVSKTAISTHMQVDSNSYVYIDHFETGSAIGYNFRLEKFEGDTMTEKLWADRILWDSVANKWNIENYSIRKIEGLKENMIYGKSMDTILDMRPKDFEAYDNMFTVMTTKELNERIEKEKIRGTGMMTDLLLEKYQRFINPFAVFILTLMGVALSSKKVRGGIGLSLGIGIALSFVYIVLIHFATMFSSKGGLSPVVAVILPTLIFLTLSVILILKAPK